MSDPHRKDGSIGSSRGVTSRIRRSLQFGPSLNIQNRRPLPEILAAPTPPEDVLITGYASALAAQTAADAAALAAQTAADAAAFACPTLSEILVTLTPAQKDEIDAYMMSNPPVPEPWSLSSIQTILIPNQRRKNETEYIIPKYDLGLPPREPMPFIHTGDYRPPLGIDGPIYNFIPHPIPNPLLPGQQAKRVTFHIQNYPGTPTPPKAFYIGFESYNIDSAFWLRTISNSTTNVGDPYPSADTQGRPLVGSILDGSQVRHAFASFSKNNYTFTFPGDTATTTLSAAFKELEPGFQDDFIRPAAYASHWARKADLIPAYYYSNEAEARANNWLTDRLLLNGVPDDTYYLLPDTFTSQLVKLS
jgi:hypothetical protein